MNDWEERWIETGLQEIHGSKPPDLSGRIVLALEERPQGPLPEVRRARRRPVGWWLAAAALLTMALLAGSLLRSDTSGGAKVEAAARLDLSVIRGVVECIEADPASADAPMRRSRHAAGSVASFAASAGNSLYSEAPSAVGVGPFGVLVTGADTKLEVRAMEFSWKQGVYAASSLTLAVVTGVVTWHTLSRTGTGSGGEVVRLEADRAGADGAATLASENERLRERLRDLEQQVAELHTRPERELAPAPAVAEPPPPEPPPPGPTPAELAFSDAAYSEALAAVDWKLVGDVTHEMGPMLVDLAKLIENGGEVPPELAIQIQQLNSKLLAQLPTLLKAELPGFGANGAYTHPLVVGNSLASTLQAAGLPLDAGQQDRMAGLVRAFATESQVINGSQHEFALEGLLAETEMKDRFYGEVSTLLGPEQNNVMYPPGAKDYDGVSLFSTGLMTRPFTDGVPSSSPADFARIASNRLGEEVGFDEATTTRVRAVVERVMAASPELWQDKAGATETKLRMLKAGRTSAALRRQLQVMREIQRQVPLTPEQQKKLASLRYVLVPLPK